MAGIRHAIKRGNLIAGTAALTATGNGSGVNMAHAEGDLIAILNVTAVSGTTPNMALKLQSSPDNSVWTDVPNGAFTAVTAAGRQTLGIPETAEVNGLYLRAAYTITGTTPSFTTVLDVISLGTDDSVNGDTI